MPSPLALKKVHFHSTFAKLKEPILVFTLLLTECQALFTRHLLFHGCPFSAPEFHIACAHLLFLVTDFMYQKPGCEAGEGLSGAWVVPVDLCEAAPEQRVKVSVSWWGPGEK